MNLIQQILVRFKSPGRPDGQRDSLVELFRWQILIGYGFNEKSRELLRTAPLKVGDISRPLNGGGFTFPDRIELNGIQHEAALHEFVHWVWEREVGLLTPNPDMETIDAYMRDYRRLAEDKQVLPAVREYAILQLFGDSRGFPGVIKLKDYDHAFTSLSSYCMGKFESGPRKLPDYMQRWMRRVFTGAVQYTPYYEGGVP